jgi:DNA-binding transcriptional regulator/RsmH inhibitor MraZ
VLVHGAIDRVELWNPSTWTAKVQPEESWLLGDEDDGDDGDHHAGGTN